jgi:hypothetical protein
MNEALYPYWKKKIVTAAKTSKSRGWTPQNTDLAFRSGEIVDDQWLDVSGNNNHLDILAPYYASNGAWGLEVTSWITDYGFSTYHEFVYDSSANYAILFSLGASGSSDKYIRLQVDQANNRLRIFNRIPNASYYGTTNELTNGQSYRVLVNWISKDDIKVYLNGSATPCINATGMDWTWSAFWNRVNVGITNNGGSYVYSAGGTIKQTRVISGTATWATIGANVTGHYYHVFNPVVLRDFDLSGNNRHLTVVSTALPTVKIYSKGVNPCLNNGYEICKHVNNGATYYDNLYLPLLANGNSLVNETVYPWRNADPPAPATDEWKPVEKVAGGTTYNGCDIKIAFPYNVMTAAADGDLGALFTGTTPNQLDPYSIWDDHLENHVLFVNKGVVDKVSTGWQRWYNKTPDANNLAITEIFLFKAATTDHVKVLKYFGYHTTPSILTGGNIYRMVNENDSFKLGSAHLTAAKFAGLHDLFFEKDIADASLKCRYSDIEKINGRNIFCDETTLYIYPKPLLPSHFEQALDDCLGLTDIENIITTADGVNYFDIDYERYVVTKDGTINFNPTAAVAAKYDIFDRRNVVGTAKEIWHADMVLASAFWTWNLVRGLKKAYQPSVSKYIQAAYSGKLFIRQDWDYKNNLICPYIISFGTPLAGAAKTAMFEFIDFPETINEPAIVGDGTTDDAVAINAAMASNAAVMLYEKAARTQTSVAIPEGVELIIADSSIRINDDINLNVIRNADFTGDGALRLSGYGVSVIDGNGANQDRNEYDPVLDHNPQYVGVLFGTVNGLHVKGLEIRDTAMWAANLQMCDNSLVEHIRLMQLGSQPNQDGVDVGFGTQNTIVRYISGQTNDDFAAILNYDNTLDGGIYPMNVNGTRDILNLYYRNLRADGRIIAGSGGAQLIRIYGNQNHGIRDVEWQNCYGYTNILDGGGFGSWLSLILFSDYEDIASRSDVGENSGYVFNNIRGSSTRNVRFLSGNYSDVEIQNLVLDDKNEAVTTHILVTNHILTNILINSILDYEPTAIFTEDGGTLTNFVHNEVINY